MVRTPRLLLLASLVAPGLIAPGIAHAQGATYVPGSAYTQGTAPNEAFPPVWQSWLTGLTQAGYTVTPGAAVVSSVAFCQQVVDPVFGTCFISDPEDPYVLPMLPVEPGQYVDPYFGQLGALTLPNGQTVSTAFRLDPAEAELVIVNLPPTAAYFSYQGYVFTRPIANYPGFSGRTSPDPARADLTASTNNSIDNKTIMAPFGVPWAQGVVAFISTPNAAIAGDMASHLSAVGGNPAWLFTDPIGSNANPGLGQSADDFQTLLRYLDPQDPAAAASWLSNVSTNVHVYRIAPPAALQSSRYGEQPLRNKYFNLDESSYAGDLAELSSIFATWLKTQENNADVTIATATGSERVNRNGTILSGNVGFSCISHGLNCNDDEQDGLHWNASVGSVPAGNLFVLTGVNQAVTNNTTVLSLSVTDSKTNTGVLGISQTNPAAAGFATGTITGSAAAALQYLGLWSQASPALQTAAPSLFVRVFTRGCAPPQTYCDQSFTTDVPTSVIPSKHPMYIDQRSYVLPGYPNSANPTHLLRFNAIY